MAFLFTGLHVLLLGHLLIRKLVLSPLFGCGRRCKLRVDQRLRRALLSLELVHVALFLPTALLRPAFVCLSLAAGASVCATQLDMTGFIVLTGHAVTCALLFFINELELLEVFAVSTHLIVTKMMLRLLPGS